MAFLAYVLLAFLAAWLITRTRVCSNRWSPVVVAAIPLIPTGKAILTGRALGPIELLYQYQPFASLLPESVRPHHVAQADVVWQMIPWDLAVRQALALGQWPLWNPYMLGGAPLAAAMQSAVYWPASWIGWLLDPPAALTFKAAATALVAAAGAYLFLRRIDCSETAALLGSAVWALGTPVMYWLEWPIGAAIALFPLVLYSAESLFHDAWTGARLLSLSLVLLIAAGHPETVLHVVAVAVLWTVARIVATRRLDAGILAAGVLAGVAALGLTAVILLPFRDAVKQSAQYAARRVTAPLSDRSRPLGVSAQLALRNLSPWVYGKASDEVSKHPPELWLPDNGYAGSLALTIALYAMVRSRRRLKWAIAIMGIAGVMLGASMGPLCDLLGKLPLFQIALNERLVFLAAFAIAVLTAFGLDALRSDETRLPAACVAAVAVVLVAGLALLRPSVIASGLSAGFFARESAMQLIPLLAALAVVMLRPRLAVSAVFVLILAQRWAETSGTWASTGSSLYTPAPGVVSTLPKTGEPYRVTGWRRVMPPNTSAYLGLEDIRGYEAMTLARLVQIYPAFTEMNWAGPNWTDDLTRPAISMMNVRFAVANANEVPPPGWRLFGSEDGYAVFENTAVFQRAFIPEFVTCGDASSEVTRQLVSVKDLRKNSWVQGGCESGTEGRRLPNGRGAVRSTARGGTITIDAAIASPAWVVVTQPAWRGWRATTGGRRIPLQFGNHAFLAFRLPAGRHTVELRYLPRSFVLGARISAVTAAAVCALVIFMAVRRVKKKGTT